MAISTATVKAYCDTGFNTVNIPDSPATLQSAAGSVVTLDTLNCLPLSGITTSITVKSFANLPKADYVSIAFAQDSTTYYGAIVGYEYLSLDTVRLDIVLDGWLTCRDKGIQSISGVTKRVHVPKSSDTFGAYTEEDPLLVCAEPLEIKTTSWKMTGDNPQYDSDDPVIIIASTVDLFMLGEPKYKEAWTYTSETVGGEEDKVTVPKIPAIEDNMTFTDDEGVIINVNTIGMKQHARMWFQTPSSSSGEVSDIIVPCVNYFDGSNPQVVKGISEARGLGVENGIIAQYMIPAKFLSMGAGQSTIYGRFALGENFLLNGNFAADYSYSTPNTHDFYLDYSGDLANGVQNKRLLCGDINKFGIISPASGNSYEARPEDLVHNDYVTEPTIIMTVDPREGGKPYYKFEYINEDNDIFCRGLVPGENWQNAPITQYQNSGYTKEMTNMKNNYNLALDSQLTQYNQSIVSALTGILSGGFSGGGSSSLSDNSYSTRGGSKSSGYNKALSANGSVLTAHNSLNNTDGTTLSQGKSFGMSSAANFGINVIGTAGRVIGNTINTELAIRQMEKQRLVEMEAFMLNNFTVAPTIMFPRVPGLVDFVGNGIVIYRYRPTDNDIARLDKVLNAYGYAHTKMLELTDFSNRSRYNYVMASGVKINCNGVARFVREAAEDQIAMGVRVWHRKPDNDYATANN